MESAFGVDHGEVSKALAVPMPKMPKLGGALKQIGTSMGNKTLKAGTTLNRTARRQAGMGNYRTSNAARYARQGVSRAGAAMRANPMATGAATVGVGAAGVGGASYAMGNRRNRNIA